MEEQCFNRNVQCAIIKKLRFIEKQEASRLLSKLGSKIHLSKIALLGDFFKGIEKVS